MKLQARYIFPAADEAALAKIRKEENIDSEDCDDEHEAQEIGYIEKLAIKEILATRRERYKREAEIKPVQQKQQKWRNNNICCYNNMLYVKEKYKSKNRLLTYNWRLEWEGFTRHRSK